MVVAGSKWFWMVLYGAGWCRPVPDSSGRFWLDLLIGSSSFRLIWMLLGAALIKFSWFWPVQDSCCSVWIVVAGSILLFMVYYGVGWFLLFPYSSDRF